MKAKTWGDLFPDTEDKEQIEGKIASMHMELFRDLKIAYSPDVERYMYGFYFPDTIDSMDFYAEAMKFDEKHKSMLFPLSYFWVTTDLFAPYLGFQQVDSPAGDMLEWLEHTRVNFEGALDSAVQVMELSPSDAIEDYIGETLIPSLNSAIKKIADAIMGMTDIDTNVIPMKSTVVEVIIEEECEESPDEIA